MQHILPTEISVHPTPATPSKGKHSAGQQNEKTVFENELDRHSKQDVKVKPESRDAADGKAAKVAAAPTEAKSKTEGKEGKKSAEDKSPAKDKEQVEGEEEVEGNNKPDDSVDDLSEAEDWFSLIENARNLSEGEMQELQEAVVQIEEAKPEWLQEVDLDSIEAGSDNEEASAKLQALLADLMSQLDMNEGELESLDMEQLRSMLASVIEDFEWQGQPLTEESKEQLLVLLDVQLDALETADEESPEPEGQQLVANLLAQLNQMLPKENDNSRSTRGAANQPSPVVQAMAKASEELRQQMQSALSDDNAKPDDAEKVDNLRRLFADTLAQQNTGSENRPQQNSVQSANNAQTLVNNSANTLSTQQRQAQEAQQSSAKESARQTQQAIDILGPQAPQQLRERISVMFNSRTQAAEIRLDPPDLGRMQIRINLSQEQTAVSFQVTNPQAREALEQSIPRLRELLEEQGLNLSEANVSEQSEQQAGSDEGTAGFASSIQSGDEPELDEQAYIEADIQPLNGRIDYYA
ncbi:hypothetical protein CWE09_11710 [Aliidiomarina minuta]|uniref:Flagellar hook-length control protein-like C-terminal domain-containing protein n=1 Tax=Aliidiomarina minuta TaxID=880057 RepID=A0A432W4X1_9GAMM|nr:flagellar hook-length control protein FliK [Aliidiomarina minuta]RUO24510.1 hypothetical protein CWE09_11710 [Aliidiomarina minuta]